MIRVIEGEGASGGEGTGGIYPRPSLAHDRLRASQGWGQREKLQYETPILSEFI